MGLVRGNSIRVIDLEPPMLTALCRDTTINHISRVQQSLTPEHNKKIKSMPMVVRKLRASLTTSDDNNIHTDVIMAQNILVMHLSADLFRIPLKPLSPIKLSLDITND